MTDGLHPPVATLRANHKRRMSEDEVLSIAYHRNGVGGDGFYVALVRAHECDQRVLVVIVPAWAITQVDDEGDEGYLSVMDAAELSPGGGYPCFAIDPELASGPWTKPGTIAFGENSWRGDRFFDLVRAAAIDYNSRP